MIIPLCCIPRSDIHLRTEVVYWLGECQLQVEDLIFLDDLQKWKAQLMAKPVELVLVDHHNPVGLPLRSGWPVIEVIDHHQVDAQTEKQITDTCRVARIELVGSCASLVTAQILQDKLGEQMPSCVWKLLYGLFVSCFRWVILPSIFRTGALLLDTIGLGEQAAKAGRMKDLDLSMGMEIENKIGSNLFSDELSSRASLFNALVEARSNIRGSFLS